MILPALRFCNPDLTNAKSAACENLEVFQDLILELSKTEYPGIKFGFNYLRHWSMFHEDKFIKRCDQVMAFSFYIMILFLPMASAIIESFFGVLMIAFVSKRTRLYYLRSKSSLDPASPSLLKKLRDIVLAYKPTKTSLNLPWLSLR